MKLYLQILFLTLIKLSKGLLNCDIIKNRPPRDFDLSQNTISATKRNNSDTYQVYSINCQARGSAPTQKSRDESKLLI